MPPLRSFAEAVVRRLPKRLQPVVRWRFIKFGVVGASGTVVNLAMLYFAQEFCSAASPTFMTGSITRCTGDHYRHPE